MTGASRLTISPAAAVLAAGALVAAGVGAGVLYQRSRPGTATADASHTNPAPTAQATPAGATGPGGANGASDAAPASITLSPEAVSRAGIETTAVVTHAAGGELRLTATIQPNAYTHTPVTSLVGGRVIDVAVEVGARVTRGQVLARIHSPELAEAQKAYVSARARLDAHDRELERTQRLAGIGAASTQEVESAHAEHAMMNGEVGSAAARLALLGMTDEAIAALTSAGSVSPEFTVRAPRAGVVIERSINAGQNVDASTAVITIADLSRVWVIADVFERDIAHVAAGAPVTITLPALPGLTLHGTISYVAPHLDHETRTVQVRVELPNPDGRLLLGMYAQVVLAVAGERPVLAVPRSALQVIGDHTVVYVREADGGRFVERRIQPVDGSTGELVDVDGDLRAGEQVVSRGGFFVRAEIERRGPAAGLAGGQVGGASAATGVTATPAIAIAVTDTGFNPSRVTVPPGRPVRLAFTRTSETTCATAVRIPAMQIERPLPLNEAVEVTVETDPAGRGEIAFACGLDMFKGTVAFTGAVAVQ